MEIILWVGFIQGIVLSVLLLSKRNNQGANTFLSIFALIVSLSFLECILESRLPEDVSNTILQFWGVTSFLYGPLQYLYVKYLTNSSNTFTRKELIHFILPAVYLVSVTLQFVINSPDLDYYMMLVELLVYEILFLQILAYAIASLRMVVRYRSKLKDNVSTMESQKLAWLYIMMILLLIVYISSIVAFHLNSFMQGYEFFDLHIVTQFASMLLVYVISYFALAQPMLFFQLSTKQQKE